VVVTVSNVDYSRLIMKNKLFFIEQDNEKTSSVSSSYEEASSVYDYHKTTHPS
jgi:hypothetical protein